MCMIYEINTRLRVTVTFPMCPLCVGRKLSFYIEMANCPSNNESISVPQPANSAFVNCRE